MSLIGLPLPPRLTTRAVYPYRGAVTSRASSKAELTQDQRRIVVGSSIALVGILTLAASFNYMLPDMIADLGASEEESTVMRQISSLGALLVVFLAGVLGERLGERRVIIATGGVFAVGSLIVTVAPNITIASAGLLLANIGKSVMAVVGIAYVTVSIRDKAGRATAFSAVSSVQPMAYLVMPLLAGLLLLVASWRTVSLTWVLGGLAACGAAVLLFPRDAERERLQGEMLTPALAGLALATFVDVFGTLRGEGPSTRFWISVTVGVASVLALVIAYRRLSNPTLSLAPLRHGGLVVLLLVVILVSFANLYYYSTLLFQIVYGYSALGAAVLMVPAQVAGICGAVVVRKVLQRKGVTYSGTLMIGLVAVTLLLSTLLQPGSPLVLPVALVALYGFASLGAVITMTNAVMDLSRHGDEGDTSAYKSAASNIGLAVGVTIMSGVVAAAGYASMNAQLSEAGIPAAEASAPAWDLMYGAAPQDVADQYGIPLDEVNQLEAMDQVAYVQAYRAHGLVGGVITMAAAGVFLAVRRRMEGNARKAAPAP